MRVRMDYIGRILGFTDLIRLILGCGGLGSGRVLGRMRLLILIMMLMEWYSLT